MGGASQPELGKRGWVFRYESDVQGFARYINTKMLSYLTTDHDPPNTEAQALKLWMVETFIKRMCKPFVKASAQSLKLIAVPSKTVLDAYASRARRTVVERNWSPTPKYKRNVANALGVKLSAKKSRRI